MELQHNFNNHPTGMLDRDQRTTRPAHRRQLSGSKLLTSLCPDCYSIYNNISNKNKINSCHDMVAYWKNNVVHPNTTVLKMSLSSKILVNESHLGSHFCKMSSNSCSNCYTRACDISTSMKNTVKMPRFYQSSASSLSNGSSISTSTRRRNPSKNVPKFSLCKLLFSSY